MNRPAALPARTRLALVAILAAYACARCLEVAPTPIPRLAIVALDVLSALTFALVDGARHFRLRGILIFAALCIVVGNVTENLSIATGFPFGHYYFATLMGPKLFRVPILLGLAYIGMAYASWIVASAIVGRKQAARPNRILVTPLVASFVMVAWDLAQDPVWATILHGWVWRDGGPWFGVPVSNYLGWFGTVFTIYLLFAWYLAKAAPLQTLPESTSQRPAIAFYMACAAGNVLQILARQSQTTAQDPSGHIWRKANITAASALVSIFLMGSLAALAWFRLSARHTQPASHALIN